MKKNKLLIIVIIILLIIAIFILTLNIKYKYNISKILEIDNINDFSIKKISRSYGIGNDPMFITFKISIVNYNKYSLNYYDVNTENDFYKGEISNKKTQNGNYYICCYETSGYNNETIKTLNNAKNNLIQLKFIKILLIIIIIIFIIKMINTIKKNNNNV